MHQPQPFDLVVEQNTIKQVATSPRLAFKTGKTHSLRRLLIVCLASSLSLAIGCAGGPYDYGYNNGYYNGQQTMPGAVMPPTGAITAPNVVYPQGTVLPPGTVLPQNNVLPPGTALPQTNVPTGNMIPQASVIPPTMQTAQNLPYGYPIGTNLASVGVPAAGSPTATIQPNLTTPAPGLSAQPGVQSAPFTRLVFH